MKKNDWKRGMAFGMTGLILLSSAGILTGCTSPQSEAQKEVKTSSGEMSAEGADTENGPVTIRLVHYMGEQTKRDALDQMLAAFSEAYPDIKVDVEVVASSSYVATYKNYIAAGEAPDIMFGKPQTMTEFVEGGYFMDLTGEACLENVLPILTDECKVNGGIYGFPIDAQVKACFYNKKMFRDAGVEVQKTKTEFL